MNDIYKLSMTVNFLIQTTRVLNIGNYDDDELRMVYEFISNVNDDVLNDYHSTCTILSYDNDLELYIEVVNTLITIFEEKEEYEKCEILKNKKEESLLIIKSNTI